jgi:NitT/TauT family transport system substrate-binding protein
MIDNIVDKVKRGLHRGCHMLWRLNVPTSRRWSASRARVLGFGLLLAAAAAHAQTLTTLRVGYSNVSGFAGLFIAKDQGMFARHGILVDPVLIALNSTMPAALVGGSLQIAGPTPPVFVQAVEGGLDLVVIAGCSVNDTTQPGQGVIARPGVIIKTAKDFEGKRVGVPGLGSYMHVMFRRWLTDKGADDKKVNFVEIPFAQGGDVLRAGNVDAIISTDPYYSRVLDAKQGTLVVRYLMEMPDGVFSIFYAANRDWATHNPTLIKGFRESLDEANAYLAKEPVKSRDILARAMRLPPDAMASIVIPKLKTVLRPADLTYWIDALAAQGITKGHPNAANLILQP